MEVRKHLVVHWLQQVPILVCKKMHEAQVTEISRIVRNPVGSVHHKCRLILETSATISFEQFSQENHNWVGLLEGTVAREVELSSTSKIHRVLYVPLANVNAPFTKGNSLNVTEANAHATGLFLPDCDLRIVRVLQVFDQLRRIVDRAFTSKV